MVSEQTISTVQLTLVACTSRASRQFGCSNSLCELTKIQRIRQYRVGLNLFNINPDKGISYFIDKGFLRKCPRAVARFLRTAKGLSKQMIGEYIGNLQKPFNKSVIQFFAQEFNFDGMEVDVALRKFQTSFQMPGEAQKIEKLVEVFSHQYLESNHNTRKQIHSSDTLIILAYSIMMLHTDLHSPTLKSLKKIKLHEFIRNLRSVDDGHDLDKEMLVGIYKRIKAKEFKTDADNVIQMMKVQNAIVHQKENLSLPGRRFVSYCRLNEVHDVTRKTAFHKHRRELFLFNDSLMITKIFRKRGNRVTYSFRRLIPLHGLNVTLFETLYYPYGIRLSENTEDKEPILFNASGDQVRSEFLEILTEAILEAKETEKVLLEFETEGSKYETVEEEEKGDSKIARTVFSQQTIEDFERPKESTTCRSFFNISLQGTQKLVRRGSA